MIAASIFDHPGILLLVIFVTVVRWLLSKAKDQTQTPQRPSQPPAPPPSQPISRGGEAQSEEERVRKFLEALGQPPGTTPPKVTPRRRAVPPTVFPRLPPLKTVPPALPKTFVAPPPLPLEIAPLSPANISAPDFQVRDVARQTSSEPARETPNSAARFAGRINLGTPQDLRTAIVLREIFGPPRSLQAFDLTRGF